MRMNFHNVLDSIFSGFPIHVLHLYLTMFFLFLVICWHLLKTDSKHLQSSCDQIQKTPNCSALICYKKWIKLSNFSTELDIGPNPWTARVVVIMHLGPVLSIMGWHLGCLSYEACFCKTSKVYLYGIIYFLYPGVLPNLFWLFQFHISVNSWLLKSENSILLSEAASGKEWREKSAPNSSQVPLFPGCEVVLQF